MIAKSCAPADFHVPIATTPRRCVPGLGTPRSHVHASSVSCTLAIVERSMTTFPLWNAIARSAPDSTTSSCVESSSRVTMRLVCQRRRPRTGPFCLQEDNDRRRPAPRAVQDWFGDPARVGSPAGPGDPRARRPRPRRARRGRAARRRRRRGAARRDGRGLRAAARARRRAARRRARGIRSPRRDHLLAQGVRPAHDAVPRPLPLLRLRRHPRAAAQAAQAGVHVARAGARGRAAGPGARLQGGAAHARRPPRGPLARGARLARRARLRLDARLRRAHRAAHHRRDRPARAPEPRRHERGRAADAAPHRPVDGHDARDDLAARCSRSPVRCTTARPTRTPRCGWR